MKKNFISAKTLVFLLLFSIRFFSACQNGLETQVTPIVSKVLAPSKNEFSFTIKKDGTFTVSDKNFYENYPQFAKAILTISNKISQKTNEDVTIHFKADGSIECSKKGLIDESLDASSFLIKEGEMRLFEGRLNMVFDENGLKSVSKPEIFVMFPEMENKFKNLGKEIAYRLRDKKAKEITLSITEDGKVFFIVPNQPEREITIPWINPTARTEGDGCTYASFKACVGDLWWLVFLNVIVCAVTCLLAEIFDFPF